LQTLKNLGGIENVKVGVYKVRTYPVNDMATIKIMLLALLEMKKKSYYEIPELSNVPVYFPFDYNVTLEWLHNEPEINISNFGGKMVVTAE